MTRASTPGDAPDESKLTSKISPSKTFPAKAYVGMGAATLLWATNAVAVKLVLREIPQLATTGLRVTLAALALAAAHAARGGRYRMERAERTNILKLGLFGIAASFLCFTTGLNYTSVSHAVFLNSIVPVLVLAIAGIQGLEPITGAKIAGLVLALGGMYALVMDQAFHPLGGRGAGWMGDLLIIGSAIAFAWFTVESKKTAMARPSVEFNAFVFLAAALWLSPLLAWEGSSVNWSAVSWTAWTSLFYSAVLGSAGAYLTYHFSLRLLPPSRAAAFHYLQPVLAAALGFVIFHERLTARFAIGAALILAGLWVAGQDRMPRVQRNGKYV